MLVRPKKTTAYLSPQNKFSIHSGQQYSQFISRYNHGRKPLPSQDYCTAHLQANPKLKDGQNKDYNKNKDDERDRSVSGTSVNSRGGILKVKSMRDRLLQDRQGTLRLGRQNSDAGRSPDQSIGASNEKILPLAKSISEYQQPFEKAGLRLRNGRVTSYEMEHLNAESIRKENQGLRGEVQACNLEIEKVERQIKQQRVLFGLQKIMYENEVQRLKNTIQLQKNKNQSPPPKENPTQFETSFGGDLQLNSMRGDLSCDSFMMDL